METVIEILIIVALTMVILYNVWEIILTNMFYKRLRKEQMKKFDDVLDEAFKNILKKAEKKKEDKYDKQI